MSSWKDLPMLLVELMAADTMGSSCHREVTMKSSWHRGSSWHCGDSADTMGTLLDSGGPPITMRSSCHHGDTMGTLLSP